MLIIKSNNLIDYPNDPREDFWHMYHFVKSIKEIKQFPNSDKRYMIL